MATELRILGAGAAQGLVGALRMRFFDQTGATIAGRFGAVGAMREALLAGEACDVMIVTGALTHTLAAAGQLRGDTCAALGKVRTGVAVRADEPVPDIATPDTLKAALLAAPGLYFPDPVRATAGIHFAAVLKQLGIHDQLMPRFHTFPNGATAMRELAATSAPGLIGCTQITEINDTEGIRLVGALPDRFELATVYTAAVTASCTQPELALRFIELLSGPQTQALRAEGGFEFGPDLKR